MTMNAGKPMRMLAGVLGVVGLLAAPLRAQDLTELISSSLGMASEESTAPAATRVVPVIVLEGPIEERADPFAMLTGDPLTLRRLTETLAEAAGDDTVEGVLVRIEGPQWGLAQAMEFREAMVAFAEGDKPLWVSFDSAGSLGYVVASAADEIVMPPVGLVELTGGRVGAYYMADMLEKIGAEAEAIAFGDYKDALSPLTDSGMGPKSREQLTRFLEDYFGTFVSAVAEGRGVTEEEAERMMTAGVVTSDEALEGGLIDRIAYLEDLYDLLSEEWGEDLEFQWDYGPLAPRKPEAPNLLALLSGSAFGGGRGRATQPQVAVVYALGPIYDGRAQDTSPFGGGSQAVYSESFIDEFDAILKENDVRAVVLRVNSPGGSAIASDRIWNRLEKAQDDGLPVVVSMGDLAASGGYYIAMGADRIVAQPTTITGSIGVIGGKLTLGDTYEKIGVNKEMLTIGPYAEMFDETKPWTEGEREELRGALGMIYETFTRKAAEGRGMAPEALEERAGGRIWSGLAAEQEGLVDEIGGLDRAIAIARELAGAPDLAVELYPRELTIMEAIEKALGQARAGDGPLAAVRASATWQAVVTVLPEPVVEQMWAMLTLLDAREPGILLLPVAFTAE